MKNIHVLPTDKPSRLQKNKFNNLFLSEEPKSYSDCTNQNIYITNDEDKYEGDWVLHNNKIHKVRINKGLYLTLYEFEHIDFRADICKKIILTTDQDLIADGVQAIDNEFLEWFVKNPSCDFVDVEHYNNQCRGECGICDNTCGNWYKIIIPKEEPKQETLEEVAERYYEENIDQSNIPREHYEIEIKDLMIGFAYKWQQQQNKNLYSEEDLKEAFFRGCYSERKIKPREKCWEEFIEQFKKK